VFDPLETELEAIVLAELDTLEIDVMLDLQLLAEMMTVKLTDDVTMKTDVFVMLALLETIAVIKCLETASLSLLLSTETHSAWKN
jgi:hypothetical protein